MREKPNIDENNANRITDGQIYYDGPKMGDIS